MHPLDGAYARLARAEEHLKELKSLHETVCHAQANATVVHVYGDRPIQPGEAREVIRVDNTRHSPVPDRCFILLGDVAHNLRTSLNYLIVQLAILDVGQSFSSNAFPIEKKPELFKGNAPRVLEGLNEGHMAAIERLQPYNGEKWLEVLRRLSNADRHKNLVIVAHDQRIGIEAASIPSTDGGRATLNMKMKINPTLRIVLDDGMPLIETLEELKSHVAKTLESFKPEFE